MTRTMRHARSGRQLGLVIVQAFTWTMIGLFIGSAISLSL